MRLVAEQLDPNVRGAWTADGFSLETEKSEEELVEFFLNEYERERKQFEKSTNIPNLLSVGRNGEFSHIFMEDVYWRTRRKVGDLLEKS